ncbi:DUF4179 domain-containing protein [Paenibacillus sp. HJL G12]|uniref:DUF4179 domain-containing protein n=1 Tax=Paenibacillus dendrobii TaxID=2691084 RepID=A0A7X3IF98_9BACL|nr:DUF4179 domain-containing protein [Paenibacillus dendrobii]MWV42828.1 DUF4179 domain-containing protein [Paenibacillus dendrobii]
MVLDKEERVLMQDVNDVKRNVEAIREIKITTAVRGGVSKGRKREMRRIYKYGIGAVAAAAAAVIIIFASIGSSANEVEEKVIQTASANSVTDFELFRPIGQRDQGFAAAMEQGLLKPIKQGVEKKGYRVDVAGAVSDGRKAFIMFSVQNHTQHQVSPVIDSLYFGDVEAPSAKAEAKSVRNSYRIMPGETAYYVYTTNLLPSVDYSKDTKMSVNIWDTVSQKYEKGLDIKFDLDTKALKDEERIYHPSETLTVDGQKINVSQVRFTPLNTYVDLEYDKANDQQIFKVINPVVIGKSGDHTEKLYYPEEVLKDNTKVTLVYKSSQLDQLDTTSLKVFGIAAVKKDQLKVVVDLKKREILAAPDDLLQILPSDQQADDEEVYFYRKLEQAQVAESLGMWLAPTFTDANGKQHKMLSPKSTSHSGTISSTKEDTMEDETPYNFGKGALNYPQPLTIEVKQYWVPIMDSQTVELASKK